MKILLDTHAFLWFIDDSPRLSGLARTVIKDAMNAPLLSTASLGKTAITVDVGKLVLAESSTFREVYDCQRK